jgi:hypothetical protein
MAAVGWGESMLIGGAIPDALDQSPRLSKHFLSTQHPGVWILTTDRSSLEICASVIFS